MNDITWWYLEVIQKELEQLREGHFTGNVEFKINFKDGGIANLNSSLNRSYKKPNEEVK